MRVCQIDVYAVGVILYEMVTGEVPFRGSNYLNVLSRIIADEARPALERRAEVGEDLDAVIRKAMSKDRASRYRDMAELDSDLCGLPAEYEALLRQRMPSEEVDFISRWPYVV